MSEFTASNGVGVRIDGRDLDIRNTRDWVGLCGTVVLDALREFYQHEGDQERGRWRWPEHPDFVVYPKGDGWIVLSEVSANSKHYSHREHASIGSSLLTQAMRAYFEAHPERKPWHDAKPWETWVFTIDGGEQSATLDEDREFRDRSYNTCSWMHVTDERITAARRIWPVSDD